MDRRPERKSALSLTRATRITGDLSAADGVDLADGDAADFMMDRAASRRIKRVPPGQTVVLDDLPMRVALSSVKCAARW
jgi:hypothetical protein